MFIFALCVPLHSAPQGDPAGLSAASRAYHERRLTETEPTYSRNKIRALIEGLEKKGKGAEDEGIRALPGNVFNYLSIPEKFTYCMTYGEVFSQNCMGMPAVLNEQKLIFSEPCGAFGGELDWSDRQLKFLHSHRKEILGLLRDTIQSQHEVGVNLKQTIVELTAYELIPDIVTVFNRQKLKDLDILSVACVLMKDGRYQPFLKSQTFRKMYGAKKANYKSSINDNPQNEQLTIQRAMAYYKSKTG